MTEDLAAFLNARLDEDERAAKGWHHPEWERRSHAVWMRLASDYRLAAECPLPMRSEPSPADHIARHDPARVLREVEAGRKLIAEYERALEKAPGNTPLINALERLMQARAAVYSDHPDYRQEWKP